MATRIGVLALQGAVSEHVHALENSGSQVSLVKNIGDLEGLDGLVLPGGESTMMRRMMDRYGLFEAVKQFAAEKPVFGTCAGLILMAKQIEGRKGPHLSLLDIDVKRNAFGRQVESFEADLAIKGISDHYTGVFIRAPYIKSAAANVDVLATYEGHIVACRQERFLCCAFHPELTSDPAMHRYFVQMVNESR
ncbi:pyridoxal 5'-phosphate synthase glutaminase subunit PdxT [Sporolactobacillus terrae]|uniref:Pyridoxal 5'-phosphate synthase subunit PdxT n=1 Tax=Sporolactobacillus terrae TaxID=269673 RepID=A0A410D4Z3_9BACL|nr:pyridoxal 5'-phosphate synthase glutaminase subunit PdxT [Sporolactobacillus terrae]QAA21171.1 pyridoxal 5'-phosphate synthase glutaminase subunit PdxT [Sporolactobacillus terrae]QAA24144.1 pyridoxal 5'-phosphate synthase glutaminase subunit PdxT [Sporolactobacillus terrae]UAK15952.1 pyridoxal 5'-phosphate synthase glutaminase subunit PdxT [Sporolactobacillus terrae]BBN97306.1 pyridoxal 5'-phosphate synthase subunit PdxT [Sporolactobacillus terrae]